MTFDRSDSSTSSPPPIPTPSPSPEASTYSHPQEEATHHTSSAFPLRPTVTTALPVYIHRDLSSLTTANTEAVKTQRTLFEDDDGFVMSTDHSKIGSGNQVPGRLSHPGETKKEQYSPDHDHTPPLPHTTSTASSSTISPFTHMQCQPRHPPKIQNSLYTRFFRLETDQAKSGVIVRSSWLSTGWLLGVRSLLFLYTSVVLITDMFRNDRPQFAFCYLTQLSYFGLISYLATVSWHTLSEWRRERGLRARKANSLTSQNDYDLETIPSTTIERQHWLLTDMNFFLYHTSCTFHVIVPILFWGYLGIEGDIKVTAVDLSPDALWRNYSFHGGDLIVLMIEIIINTMPIIPSHVVIVFVICLLYLAEAHLVHTVDGFWIYPFLDTTGGPMWVAMYIGVGFVILCAFVAMYYLHRIRNWIRARGANSTIGKDMSSTIDTAYNTHDLAEVRESGEMADDRHRQRRHVEENDEGKLSSSSSSATLGSILDRAKVPAPAYSVSLTHQETNFSVEKSEKRSRRSNSQSSITSTLVNIQVHTSTTATPTAPTHNRCQSIETLFSSSANAESRLQKVVEEDDSLGL